MGALSAGAAGAAVLTAAGPGRSEAEAKGPDHMTAITLNVNNRPHHLLVEPRWTLLFVLRDHLGLTGTKVGCERGECGACTVLIDDQPRYACMTLAVEAEGRRIVTIEGLMRGEKLGSVQEAFLENDAYQCGYCTPGQEMSVEGLLRRNPDPSDQEILTAMSGNLCRCGAYPNIFKAARQAADRKKQ
jgi:xanthine dehydrogenase YagT iron-sulfur-binding subunit